MRVILIASLFLTSWPVTAAGRPADCNAVLNQSASHPLAHPFVGHLVNVGPDLLTTDHLCYGTLVSPTGHVLTAAHCLVSNQYNTDSRPNADLHLCMGDGRDLPLRVATVNPNLDYALLQATSTSRADLAPYGWVAFAGGRPRAGLNLVRAGYGETCTTGAGTDDFHLRLNCGSVAGDSGEAVLAGNQVAGIITYGSSLDSIATSSFTIFAIEASQLGAPRLSGLFVQDLIPRTVVTGSPVDLEIDAGYRPEMRNVNLVTSIANCQTIPPEATFSQDRRQICTVTPQESFDVQYRASADWEDSNHQVNAPWDSSERDASGVPVETVQVVAVGPGDHVWTAAASPTISQNPDLRRPQFSYGATLYVGFRPDSDHPEVRLRGSYFIYSGGTTPVQPYEFSASIDGLACDTTYHYQAVALVDKYPIDGTVIEVMGQDRTFRTLPCFPTSLIPRSGTVKVSRMCKNSLSFETKRPDCRNPGPCSPFSWVITAVSPLGLPRPMGGTTFGVPGRVPNFPLEGLQCGTRYILQITAWAYGGAVDMGSFVAETASCWASSRYCLGDLP
jgi:hypothetical protein